LLDGNRLMEVGEIRRQIAEWNQDNRIALDVTAAQDLDWAVLLRPADCALVFIRPREIGPAIERLRALDLASRGWRDKIAILCLPEEGSAWVLGAGCGRDRTAMVWLWEEGSGVAPVVRDLRVSGSREFKISESP